MIKDFIACKKVWSQWLFLVGLLYLCGCVQLSLLPVVFDFFLLVLWMQLECTACGHSWYASRDEASKLTIDAPTTARSVGTAPWATAKFEEIEKKLVSPRESDKSANDVFKKTSEAYMPVLDAQKSFGRSKKEEKSETARNAE